MHTFVEAVRLRVFECVPDDAVHALVGVDLFLNRDLILGPGLEAAADVDVHAFGVLAKHHEVDVCRTAPFQRAQPLVQQFHRPVVDIEIELEPRAEQDVTRITKVRDPRIPERSKENGIELPQQVEAVRRERFTRFQKVVRAPGQLFELEPPAEFLANGLEDLQGFSRDFLADPVSGNDCYFHSIPTWRWFANVGGSRTAPTFQMPSPFPSRH